MLVQIAPYWGPPPAPYTLGKIFNYFSFCFVFLPSRADKKQVCDLLLFVLFICFVCARGGLYVSKYSYKGELLTLNSGEYLFTGK